MIVLLSLIVSRGGWSVSNSDGYGLQNLLNIIYVAIGPIYDFDWDYEQRPDYNLPIIQKFHCWELLASN